MKPLTIELTSYEANLIANLLEDRGAQCSRNQLACGELGAHATDNYWREQKDIAFNLAVKFRKHGKVAL